MPLPTMLTRPATMTLRRVADGAERTWKADEYWHLEADDQYHWYSWWWAEGNGSCDCNRLLSWCRAAGEEPPEDLPCGDSAFVVVSIVDDESGEVLYREGGA